MWTGTYGRLQDQLPARSPDNPLGPHASSRGNTVSPFPTITRRGIWPVRFCHPAVICTRVNSRGDPPASMRNPQTYLFIGSVRKPAGMPAVRDAHSRSWPCEVEVFGAFSAGVVTRSVWFGDRRFPAASIFDNRGQRRRSKLASDLSAMRDFQKCIAALRYAPTPARSPCESRLIKS